MTGAYGVRNAVDRRPVGPETVFEAAVFALSELDGDEEIEALLRIARGGDPGIREKAMFWLADSGDPRALALFEEILAGS